MTVDEVINTYQGYACSKCLSDEYLKEHGHETRDDDWNFVAEYEYGIVHLRDDGVDILVNEILRLRSVLFNAGIVE